MSVVLTERSCVYSMDFIFDLHSKAEMRVLQKSYFSKYTKKRCPGDPQSIANILLDLAGGSQK